jgi:LPXTG-motif cell wall-anchored protein
LKVKKTNIIWGVVCLVLAAVLEVLNLVLPPESTMFYVGEENMRWVPVVGLAIAGIVLLATARKKT